MINNNITVLCLIDEEFQNKFLFYCDCLKKRGFKK